MIFGRAVRAVPAAEVEKVDEGPNHPGGAADGTTGPVTLIDK
jgi:hypothetical protein